jgi:cell division protein FtsA
MRGLERVNEIIVGLDIGTTKVSTLVAEVTESDQVFVHGLGTAPSAGLRRGVMVDPEAMAVAIQNATEEAQEKAQVEIHSAYVGVTGEKVAWSRQRGALAIERPGFEIRPADLERVRNLTLNGSLGPEQEVIWTWERGFLVDGQGYLPSPVGMCGSKLEVEMEVTLAQRGFLETVRRCVKAAGLNVAGMVPGTEAIGEAVTTASEREVGIIVLDIGAGTSELVIYLDGYIQHAVVLPIGGHHVSQDLAWVLNIPFAEAEQLKLTSACATLDLVGDEESVTLRLADGSRRGWPRRQVVAIVEARMEEILDLARQEIESRVPKRKLLGGLALTGGGAQLPGTLELAQRILGVHVHLGLPTRLAGRADQVYSPLFAAPVGLIRCGARDQQRQEQLRCQRSIWGRARAWWEQHGPSWKAAERDQHRQGIGWKKK